MQSTRTTFRAGTWNTEWAQPGSAKGRRVAAELAKPDCDILCLTEAYAEVLPGGGHVIDAGSDWGYRTQKGRRKVLLWSKRSWSQVDSVGSDRLPNGRFVAGTTQTDAGPLQVVGVCVPWRDAHVRTGRKDRKPWQEHEKWLTVFETMAIARAEERTIVLGDFNQQIPRKWARKLAHQALLRAMAGFTFATSGHLEGASHPVIDHIAHTPDMTLIGNIGVWPKRNEHDRPLPDHFGVWGDFARPPTGEQRSPCVSDPGPAHV